MSIPQRCQPARTCTPRRSSRARVPTRRRRGSGTGAATRAASCQAGRRQRARRGVPWLPGRSRPSPRAAEYAPQRGWPPTAKRGKFAQFCGDSSFRSLRRLCCSAWPAPARAGQPRPARGWRSSTTRGTARPAQDGGWLHWNQNGHRPAARSRLQVLPRAGARTRAATRAVVARADGARSRATGVGEVVVSWWGRGSAENARLPLVLRAARRRGSRGRRAPRAVRRTLDRHRPRRPRLPAQARDPRRLRLRPVLGLRTRAGPRSTAR